MDTGSPLTQISIVPFMEKDFSRIVENKRRRWKGSMGTWDDYFFFLLFVGCSRIFREQRVLWRLANIQVSAVLVSSSLFVFVARLPFMLMPSSVMVVSVLHTYPNVPDPLLRF